MAKPVPASNASDASLNGKRFRIAFSFAGEKRSFVADVAAILAKRFGEDKILYDKYHEAEFAHANLAFSLPELYRDAADLIVSVFCPDYEHKEWCGLEWRAIFALIKEGKEKPIMLTRFEHVDGKGLHGLAGFIELDHKTPQQAATLILERLALNEGKPKDHYSKTDIPGEKHHSTATPNNLPRIGSFYGRVAELKQIAEALEPDARTWGVLIDGPGGMGKTTLAVRAAYDIPPDRFQRIIFLSVKDREMDDDGVRTLGNLLLPGLLEMLNELARELGQPDINKAPESERIRLLLDALRPQQVLLILDNLEVIPKADRDQLFNFVKRLPQGCKAILTSRRRIGSSADVLILQKLDQNAALATLADLALRNPLLAKTSEAERIALYNQTGGKPLLLRWTAGQIGRGSCRTFTDALTFLRSCPPDNDPLEFIFGDLAREFAEDETKVLVALTYFTLPAKVEHIAELAGLKKGPVELASYTLANRSLVVPDQEEETFTLVPMVAEFLRKHRPEVVAETGERLQNRAYALIMENGYLKHDRFPVLDAAWPTVAPALPLFLAGDNARLQTVCDALFDFLNFTGRWDEWLSLAHQAEHKAVAAGDHNDAGWRAYQAGIMYYFRGQAEEVLAAASRVEAYWRIAQAPARDRSMPIRLRSMGHRLQQDYSAALTACREALELDSSLAAESPDMVSSLIDLADVEQRSGDFAAADRDYREALRIAVAVGGIEAVAVCIGNLGDLALEQKEWAKAEALVREALALSEKVGRKEVIAGNCARLARALAQQRKNLEGLIYAQRAVEIYQKLGSPDLKWARAILKECET